MSPTNAAEARLDAILAQASALRATGEDDLPEMASPVCYAGEFASGGTLEPAEITRHLALLAGDLRMTLRLVLADGPPNEMPFDAVAMQYALWTLRVGELATARDGDIEEPAATEIAGMEVSMLAQLDQLIPGLPDNATRRSLTSLRIFLESRAPLRHMPRL